MARKNNRGSHRVRKQIKNLELSLVTNGRAMDEGPQKKKKWTTHDVRPIQPLTQAQKDMFHMFYQGQNICAHGSAGTGKTFLALFLAINEVIEQGNRIDKIIIVRSPVQLRELGHMPGDLDEKISFYETPYKDIMAELFSRGATFEDMKEAGLIKFMPTTFIRGLTWDNAIVIVDEFQNMTISEIDSVITRLGDNSRVIMCGDVSHQCDLRKEKTGAGDAVKILDKMDSFSLVQFFKEDIVRSELVKSWITTREDLNI